MNKKKQVVLPSKMKTLYKLFKGKKTKEYNNNVIKEYRILPIMYIIIK